MPYHLHTLIRTGYHKIGQSGFHHNHSVVKKCDPGSNAYVVCLADGFGKKEAINRVLTNKGQLMIQTITGLFHYYLV